MNFLPESWATWCGCSGQREGWECTCTSTPSPLPLPLLLPLHLHTMHGKSSRNGSFKSLTSTPLCWCTRRLGPDTCTWGARTTTMHFQWIFGQHRWTVQEWLIFLSIQPYVDLQGFLCGIHLWRCWNYPDTIIKWSIHVFFCRCWTDPSPLLWMPWRDQITPSTHSPRAIAKTITILCLSI